MIEPVQSGSTISIEWHDSSLVNTNVGNMSESDIEAMLDNTEMIGYGEQFWKSLLTSTMGIALTHYLRLMTMVRTLLTLGN